MENLIVNKYGALDNDELKETMDKIGKAVRDLLKSLVSKNISQSEILVLDHFLHLEISSAICTAIMSNAIEMRKAEKDNLDRCHNCCSTKIELVDEEWQCLGCGFSWGS